MKEPKLRRPSDAENWTTQDVAVYLRISLRKLHYLKAQGLLPRASRLGRRLLFKAAEIRAWRDAECPSLNEWETIKRSGSGKF